MRVIRTEFYFESDNLASIKGVTVPEHPGIAVAWFKGKFKSPEWTPPSIPDLEGILGFQIDPNYERHLFLDAALYDYPGDQLPGGIHNQQIVDYILNQDVVIERSPPVAESLKTLIAGGTNISIGSYLGYTIAGGDIPLMFITIPAGVIVMGAAVGISNGLKNGLQKTVERIFTGEKLPLKAKGSSRAPQGGTKPNTRRQGE